MRNFYTGERRALPARAAAALLVLLAADVAEQDHPPPLLLPLPVALPYSLSLEQDPHFDLALVLACLRLAAPHLQAPLRPRTLHPTSRLSRASAPPHSPPPPPT